MFYQTVLFFFSPEMKVQIGGILILTLFQIEISSEIVFLNFNFFIMRNSGLGRRFS